jgi:uncharacterized protein YlaN (UPF0358 family)
MLVKFINEMLDLEQKFVYQSTYNAIKVRKSLGKITRLTINRKNMYDDKKDEILYYLSRGINYSKILTLVGIGSRVSLVNFIKLRNLKGRMESVPENITLEEYLSECQIKRELELKRFNL